MKLTVAIRAARGILKDYVSGRLLYATPPLKQNPQPELNLTNSYVTAPPGASPEDVAAARAQVTYPSARLQRGVVLAKGLLRLQMGFALAQPRRDDVAFQHDENAKHVDTCATYLLISLYILLMYHFIQLRPAAIYSHHVCAPAIAWAL